MYRSVLGYSCWKSSENMRQNRLCDDVFRSYTSCHHQRCVMQPLNFYSISIQKFPHTPASSPHHKTTPQMLILYMELFESIILLGVGYSFSTNIIYSPPQKAPSDSIPSIVSLHRCSFVGKINKSIIFISHRHLMLLMLIQQHLSCLHSPFPRLTHPEF